MPESSDSTMIWDHNSTSDLNTIIAIMFDRVTSRDFISKAHWTFMITTYHRRELDFSPTFAAMLLLKSAGRKIVTTNHYQRLIVNFIGKAIFHIELRVAFIVTVHLWRMTASSLSKVHFVAFNHNSTLWTVGFGLSLSPLREQPKSEFCAISIYGIPMYEIISLLGQKISIIILIPRTRV